MKICLWRCFLEDLFWRFFNWIFEYFLRRSVHGDFSFGIWFWRFFLWKMKIFPFEDLFMEIFPWRFILRDFAIEVLEIFIEDLFIGDFSFWRFVRGDFSLKIYSGDWNFETILMKICSLRFFLWNMVLEIFPLRFFLLWRFVCGDFSLKIYS